MKTHLRVCVISFVAVAGNILAAAASELFFDFETRNEIDRINVKPVAGRTQCVTNDFATSGTNAVLFAFEPWLKGDWKYDAYPQFCLPVPERLRDWTQFDRLAFDIVNEGDGGDLVSILGTDMSGTMEHLEGFPLPGRTAVRHVLKIDQGTRRKMQYAKMGSLRFAVRTPRGCRAYLDNFRLYRPGEKIPPFDVGKGNGTVRFLADRMTEAQAEAREAKKRAGHLESLFAFRTACEQAGTSRLGMALGTASAMSIVRPRDAFAAEPLKALSFSLARNEYESVQLLVAATAGDLRNVRVELSELKGEDDAIPVSDLAAIPVGYVKSETPGYRVGYGETADDIPGKVPDAGWYPDLLLTFLKGVDVCGADVQSFWIRVRASESRKPGKYRGKLRVLADNGGPVEIPVSVRVRNFTLGRISPLHLELAFRPKLDLETNHPEEDRIWRKPSYPGHLAWKHEDAWTDFLADYLITIDNIYQRGSMEKRMRSLTRLKEQGRLGDFCIRYWPILGGLDAATVSNYEEKVVADVRRNYEMVKKAGMIEHAYMYGADEQPASPENLRKMKKTLELLRAAAPGVPITTTGFIRYRGELEPHGLGVGVPELDGVDMMIPTTGAYSVCPPQVEKARAAGKKVAWYICNNPDHPFPQMFLETEPIEGRILMGALAAKCKTDGFLIWSISTWNNEKCITSGPFTDWNPRTFLTDNSDAQWVCPGPDGTPLATIRLENFRDGLEDLWYVRLYEKKFGKSPDVPDEVAKDLRHYTRDATKLAAWRDRLADAIEDGN